ncbi:MAG: hypothetical protein AABY64_14425 [Bdellovibrionota bacterium]
MTIDNWKMVFCSSVLLFSGCAGIKVINPNDQNKNEGTLALDLASGKPKLVATYTCKIVASNGNRVSAIGKTEEEAQKEALAKCRDQTVISFCESKNLKCTKN